NRRDIVHALQSARQELEQGQVVCIFAEGGISRIGHLMPFKRGFEKIVQGTNFPIIPVHLDQLWGSIFSFKEGRFFWKRPKLLPSPVTGSSEAPPQPQAQVQEARKAVLKLKGKHLKNRLGPQGLLPAKFTRTPKPNWPSF